MQFSLRQSDISFKFPLGSLHILPIFLLVIEGNFEIVDLGFQFDFDPREAGHLVLFRREVRQSWFRSVGDWLDLLLKHFYGGDYFIFFSNSVRTSVSNFRRPGLGNCNIEGFSIFFGAYNPFERLNRKLKLLECHLGQNFWYLLEIFWQFEEFWAIQHHFVTCVSL